MNGVLKIVETKKGGIDVRVSVGEKTYTLAKVLSEGLTMADNGKTVDVEISAGQCKKLGINGSMRSLPVNAAPVASGKRVPQRSSLHSTGGPGPASASRNDFGPSTNNKTRVAQADGGTPEHCHPSDPAKAPYNFVPYSGKVVPGMAEADFSVFMKGRLHGTIELEIEARTALYVRGTANAAQAADPYYSSRNNPEFYAPGGVPALPGSSLRGMVRSLVEIVSGSRFSQIDDRHLYMRDVAGRGSLHDFYRKKMIEDQSVSGAVKYFVKAGHLCRDRNGYFIKPAKLVDGSQYKRNERDPNLREYRFRYLHDGSALIQSGIKPNDRNGSNVWRIHAPDPEKPDIRLTEQDIAAYSQDKSRGNNGEYQGLIAELKNDVNKVPCFYIKGENGKPTMLGHTLLFRIMYEHSLRQFVRQDDMKPDFTECLFGQIDQNTKTMIAGRLRFEDARCTSGHQPDTQARTTQILLAPKPTTFQHYLVQPREHIGSLQHYASPGAALRGYKQYWHRPNVPWQAPGHVPPENVRTSIKVMPKGSKFKGRIVFENLDPVELGALLFVLQLPEGCAHKIGMGKPLGLGSVRITARVCLEDPGRRYRDLAAEWTTQPAPVDDKDYRQDFVRYVSREETGTELSQADEWWKSLRIKELRRMLDFEAAPNGSKTAYMELAEFRRRRVLPRPTDVR